MIPNPIPSSPFGRSSNTGPFGYPSVTPAFGFATHSPGTNNSNNNPLSWHFGTSPTSSSFTATSTGSVTPSFDFSSSPAFGWSTPASVPPSSESICASPWTVPFGIPSSSAYDKLPSFGVPSSFGTPLTPVFPMPSSLSSSGTPTIPSTGFQPSPVPTSMSRNPFQQVQPAYGSTMLTIPSFGFQQPMFCLQAPLLVFPQAPLLLVPQQPQHLQQEVPQQWVTQSSNMGAQKIRYSITIDYGSQAQQPPEPQHQPVSSSQNMPSKFSITPSRTRREKISNSGVLSGNQTTAPEVSSSIFMKGFERQAGGSRLATYESTPCPDDKGILERNLEYKSVSAMPFYKNKSHEELRWEDYQQGDKGSFSFFPEPKLPASSSLVSTFASLTVDPKSQFGRVQPSGLFQTNPVSCSSMDNSSSASVNSPAPSFSLFPSITPWSSSLPSGTTSASDVPSFSFSSSAINSSQVSPFWTASPLGTISSSPFQAPSNSSNPLFGTSSSPFQSTSNLSHPLFGTTSSSPPQSTSTPLFGAPRSSPCQTTSTSSHPLFGTTSPSPQSTSTPLFGTSSSSPSQTTTTTNHPFFGTTSSSPPQSTSNCSNLFSLFSQPVVGSTSPPLFRIQSGCAQSSETHTSTSPFSFGMAAPAPGFASFGNGSLSFSANEKTQPLGQKPSPFDQSTSGFQPTVPSSPMVSGKTSQPNLSAHASTETPSAPPSSLLNWLAHGSSIPTAPAQTATTPPVGQSTEGSVNGSNEAAACTVCKQCC